MSPTAKRLRDRAIDTLIGLIGSAFLLFGTGLWNSKESVPAHDKDITTIRAEVAAQRADLKSAIADQRAISNRILDAVCDKSAQKPRTCSEPSR